MRHTPTSSPPLLSHPFFLSPPSASSSTAGLQPLAHSGPVPLPPTSNPLMPSGQQQQHMLQIAATTTVATGGTGGGGGGVRPVDASRKRSVGEQQLSTAAHMHQHQSQQQHLIGKSVGAASHGNSSSSKSNVHANVPIILVPSATQTLLNVFNAKEFLEDAVYVSPEGKMREMKRPEVVTIERKIGRDKPVAYQIRDKPELLSKRVRIKSLMGALLKGAFSG